MRGIVILLGATACWTPERSAWAESTSATNSQQLQAQNERAREKFRLGVNAFRAERLEEARQLLTEAWRLRRTYDVAASLAQVEHELGHHARAAELLDFCLNNFAPIESDTKFQQLQQVFEDVRSRVGQIDTTALPEGAEIRVDDQTYLVTSSSTPMYLEPGLHEFSIRVGAVKHERSLLVRAGDRLQLNIASKSSVVTPLAPHRQVAPVGAAPHSVSASRPTFPYYLGGGLLVAGITTAAVFQVAAGDAKSRKQALLAQPGVSECGTKGTTSTAICGELSDAHADYQFNRNLALFGYGLAATAALATAIYWLWPEPNASKNSQVPRGSTVAIGYEPSQFWIVTTGSL